MFQWSSEYPRTSIQPGRVNPSLLCTYYYKEINCFSDNFAVNIRIQPSRGLVAVPWIRTMLVNDDVQLPGLDMCKKMVESWKGSDIKTTVLSIKSKEFVMLCTFEISGPQAKIKLKQPNILVLASQRFLRQLRLSCRSEFKIKIARFGFLVSRHGTLEVKGGEKNWSCVFGDFFTPLEVKFSSPFVLLKSHCL